MQEQAHQLHVYWCLHMALLPRGTRIAPDIALQEDGVVVWLEK